MGTAKPDAEMIRVGHVSDVPSGSMLPTTFEGKPLVVVNLGEELVAFPDACLHYRIRLSEGTFRDGVVTCRWHQWGYCPATGEILADESPYATFTTFDVVVADDGDLYVPTTPRTRTSVRADDDRVQ